MIHTNRTDYIIRIAHRTWDGCCSASRTKQISNTTHTPPQISFKVYSSDRSGTIFHLYVLIMFQIPESCLKMPGSQPASMPLHSHMSWARVMHGSLRVCVCVCEGAQWTLCREYYNIHFGTTPNQINYHTIFVWSCGVLAACGISVALSMAFNRTNYRN